MSGTRVFRTDETHGVLQRFRVKIEASSEGLGWSSAFASLQREHPFEARFGAISDCLVVLYRSGPVDVTYRLGGRTEPRHVLPGRIFFLPPGYECDVSLHGAVDTAHIYLRSELFAGEGGCRNLGPLLGIQDSILEHLAAAIGEAVKDRVPRSSSFADPIAQAMTKRILLINGHGPSKPVPVNKLSEQQLARIHEFVQDNLDADVRLEAMAKACSLGTKYFVRSFKASVGKSPYQYVVGLRVERAKELLDQKTLSLPEVALRCGFCHQEHLTRMFHRFTGLTPGRYRDQATEAAAKSPRRRATKA